MSCKTKKQSNLNSKLSLLNVISLTLRKKFTRIFLETYDFYVLGTMGRLTTKEKIQTFRSKRKDNMEYRQAESRRIEKVRKRRVNKITSAY